MISFSNILLKIKRSRALPRFGRSLARLRTTHAKAVVRQARTFLREAEAEVHKSLGSGKRMRKDFQKWVQAADLNPVFEFLTA